MPISKKSPKFPKPPVVEIPMPAPVSPIPESPAISSVPLSRKLKVVFAALSMVTAISLGTVSALAIKMGNLEKVASSSTAAHDQVADIVAAVGKVLVLPQGETPTLATVADPAKLAGQPFFAHALVGDIVLIYSNEKKAILWRPSTSQVVALSDLSATPTSPVPAPAPAAAPSSKK